MHQAGKMRGAKAPHNADVMPEESKDSYADLIERLAENAPRVAAGIRASEETRRRTLAQYLPGMRLQGLDNLFEFLDHNAEVYDANTELAKIAFLIRRVRDDFETASEATLSGYVGVASDAMRDVLEVECLLLDFALNNDHLDLWLTSGDEGEAVRRKKFAPRHVRARLQEAGVEEFSRSVEGLDYKAHSAALHVSPQTPMIGHKGRTEDGWAIDSGFWEMFEHGRRIIEAIMVCRVGFGAEPGDDDDEPRGDRFAGAYERTREMQEMFMAMVEAPMQLREKLGREPTTHEVLVEVRNRLADTGQTESN